VSAICLEVIAPNNFPFSPDLVVIVIVIFPKSFANFWAFSRSSSFLFSSLSLKASISLIFVFVATLANPFGIK